MSAESSSSYNVKYLTAVSFISALGGYLFGFDFAVISGALPFLKTQFNLNEYWEGFATGCLALGAITGCIIAGNTSDKYGRRPALLLSAAIFGFSSLSMAVAPNRELFVAARFAAGIGVGMASMLSPMYIAEIAPAQVRGRMVAINQLTIVLGILITNLINYTLRNAGDHAWRWMFGLGVVPSLLFLLGVLWLPESPRWLIKNNAVEKATIILRKIGGVSFVNNTIINITEANSSTDINYKAAFEKAVLPALLIGIGLAVFQQFCGINVVFNYTAIIFESIGASQDDQLLQTVFIGGVNVLFTLLAMVLVDKIGRKPLMLIGAAGLAVTYFLIAVMLGNKSVNVSWFLLAAIGIYASTLAPVTWVLIAEIFPARIRAAATTIAVISLWLAYFILTFSFPVLYTHFSDKVFLMYAMVCVLGLIFVWRKVKETKGKTLEEMEDIFRGH